jgi:hexosaminidase
MNRLVDAVPPESDTARHFHDLVRRVVSRQAAPAEVEEAKSWLVLWRDNDSKLQPLLGKSELTQELAPLSTSLRQVAVIGLEALDHLEKGEKAPGDWRNQQLQFLKTAAEPQAVLLDMIAPAVTEMVQAVSAN